MSLTVGTTLQNGKFVIEAILRQSDFGVTYQATHPSINRSVVLQSFNEVLRQRNDFDLLRQKFLQEVLLFSKQPSDTVQVIDCFEENDMPFVVLEFDSKTSIPYLSDWLEIPLEEPIQEATQPTNASALESALAAAFPEAPPEAVVIAAPNAPLSVVEMGREEIAIADAEELVPVPAEPVAALPPTLKSFSLSDTTTNGSRNGVTVLVSEQSLKPKKWMPLVLMMTALITGFGGVGLGLALRSKPTPQADNPSRLSSGWFGRDQSFPPKQEWPITETPNLYPPSSAFEQPLYQPSPPVRDSGIPRESPRVYIPPAQLAPPDYQPAPGIADYPPTRPDPAPDAEPEPTAPPATDPPTPEVIQPVIPLPEPITPSDLPEIAPVPNKQPSSSSKNVPVDAPIILHQ
jgi:hypothetical protein